MNFVIMNQSRPIEIQTDVALGDNKRATGIATIKAERLCAKIQRDKWPE